MSNNIDDAISSLAVDIKLLKPLSNNPRRGSVSAIKESYQRFGQLKPIVAVSEGDGTYTVIAGNHQLMAAKELGWDEIAVSVVSLDENEALTFALADNKVSELGSTDNELLYDMLSSVADGSELLDALGWDDFAIASIENSVISSSSEFSHTAGWTAPEIITQPTVVQESAQANDQKTTTLNDSGNAVVSTDTPTSSIVTQGSTATSMSGSNNASIQFTLSFETAEQQSKWYSFLRWLKMNEKYTGETTSERLLDFISIHMTEV